MIKLIKKLLEAKNLLIIAILFSIFITIAFLSPISGMPKIDFIIPIDKVAHITIYMLLAFIWMFYFYKVNGNILKINTIVILLSLFLVYGTIIEVLQELFIDFRQADIFDVLANTFGSVLGLFVFKNVKNRIKT